MRVFVSLAALLLQAPAQPSLYLTATLSSEYFVGAKLQPSGLFRCDRSGACEHLGYNLPVATSFVTDPLSPDTLLLAAGNGLIRARSGGRDWTILTGSDVTELRDVVRHPADPQTLYFAHTHGIRMTRDGGKSWTEIASRLRRRFTETIRVARDGALIAGTENGIWRTPDNGASWTLAGAAGLQILRLEASPHDPCRFLASAQDAGLFASSDCGRTFENTGGQFGVGINIYDLAFAPDKPGRVAAGGFGAGVALSDDNGLTWHPRNAGLPALEVTAVLFDPASPGRLLAAVHDAALYASADAGIHWSKLGMEGSHITCMRFLEVRP
jgi:photosystem II stability/assembly factor-like uncharacterized protein